MGMILVIAVIQVQNHLGLGVSLLATSPGKDAGQAVIAVLEPGAIFPVPFGIAFTSELHVEPIEHG